MSSVHSKSPNDHTQQIYVDVKQHWRQYSALRHLIAQEPRDQEAHPMLSSGTIPEPFRNSDLNTQLPKDQARTAHFILKQNIHL